LSSRRTARKNAFLALYQSDVVERPLSEILERWRVCRGEFDEHALMLARGVEEECEALDGRLREVAVGWPVHRMNPVDRTILRLALYEMLHVEDVPAEVAINEAMELAQGFSGEEAPQFVGGVLRGAKEAWLGETARDDHPVEHG
jgi:transcription antitermination protein NusB